jgi:hypothetical protein
MGTGLTGSPIPVPPVPSNVDTIVVATVIAAHPHFSEDHTAIYTELKARTSDILRDKSGELQVGRPFDILESGGTLKVDGRIISYPFLYGHGNPDLNQTLVLFLKFNQDARAFTVRRAWVLGKTSPEPLPPYNPANPEIQRLKSMTNDEFVSFVRENEQYRGVVQEYAK